jgi:hypothetical protein
MAAIPTSKRGRRQAARQRTREPRRRAHTHVNRRARLGIRGFKPTLHKAPEKLERLRTPEDTPLPPKTLDAAAKDDGCSDSHARVDYRRTVVRLGARMPRARRITPRVALTGRPPAGSVNPTVRREIRSIERPTFGRSQPMAEEYRVRRVTFPIFVKYGLGIARAPT